MGELITVVVPVYNVDAYLDRCLNSVTKQTYSNLEIILVNDGSTDRSAEICRMWHQKDDRIVLIEKENEGLGAARNDAVDMAQGEYIAFIDSDDWWELDAIEVLYRNARCCNADMVYMDFYWEYLQKDGTYKSRMFCQWCIFDGVGNAAQYPELIFSADARTWSKFYRTELFRENHIQFPEHPFEDFPVNPILVLSASRICQVHKALYHYDCIRVGNITTQSKNYIYIPQGLEELHDSLEKRGWLETYREAFQKYAIRLCRGVINEQSISKKDLKRFYSFLDKYCGEYMSNYQIKISYIGSYAGYQMISQNAFQSQLEYVALYDVPDTIKTRAFKFNKEGSIANSDVILLDFFMRDITGQEILDEVQSLLKKVGNAIEIIVLELFFAEKKGTDAQNSTYYSNLEEIKTKNSLLEKAYREAKLLLGEKCRFMSFSEIDSYTYLYTPYGCSPEYYNGKCYAKAFEIIGEMIKSGKIN